MLFLTEFFSKWIFLFIKYLVSYLSIWNPNWLSGIILLHLLSSLSSVDIILAYFVSSSVWHHLWVSGIIFEYFFFFFFIIHLFYIVWREGQGRYELLMMVGAGGTRTCVHPHVSRPLYHCATDAEYLSTWYHLWVLGVIFEYLVSSLAI